MKHVSLVTCSCSCSSSSRVQLLLLRTCQRAARTRCNNSTSRGTAASVAYRVRRATVDDSQAVSEIYSQTFGSGNFPGYEDNPLLQQVEASYAAAVGRETSDKLAEALQNKAQAAVEARTYRLQRQTALIKGQLAMAQGLPAAFPTEGPTELRQLAKWRKARHFVCLVVEEVQQDDDAAAGAAADDDSSNGSSSSSSSSTHGSRSQGGRLVGTATLSMMQAEAALPPPFPTGAPLRAYISNMAVVPEARRRGIATSLAAACGRIARAWGESSVLLHVAADNVSAQQLYLRCGFQPVANSQGLSGVIKGPWTQQRMAADAAALAARYARGTAAGACAAAAAAAVGSSSADAAAAANGGGSSSSRSNDGALASSQQARPLLMDAGGQ